MCGGTPNARTATVKNLDLWDQLPHRHWQYFSLFIEIKHVRDGPKHSAGSIIFFSFVTYHPAKYRKKKLWCSATPANYLYSALTCRPPDCSTSWCSFVLESELRPLFSHRVLDSHANVSYFTGQPTSIPLHETPHDTKQPQWECRSMYKIQISQNFRLQMENHTSRSTMTS